MDITRHHGTVIPAVSDVSQEIHFLDVGQAHATVAVSSDSAMVVDCPYSGVERASNVLRKHHLTKLDILVTHRDLDHCGGIAELLKEFGNESTTLYMNPVAARPLGLEDQPKVRTVLHGILSALEAAGASVDHALLGKTGSTGMISWEVLAPDYGRVFRTAAVGGSTNRTSVVLMLLLGGFRFLVPGDADDKVVGELLGSGARLSADVLLFPHHGAKLARINQLLNAVDPQYVVVSAGRRKTPPHITTLQAAASYPCRLMCTQVAWHCNQGSLKSDGCAGSIVFDCSGVSLVVKPSRVDHESRIYGLATPACLPSSGGPTMTVPTDNVSNPDSV